MGTCTRRNAVRLLITTAFTEPARAVEGEDQRIVAVVAEAEARQVQVHLPGSTGGAKTLHRDYRFTF